MDNVFVSGKAVKPKMSQTSGLHLIIKLREPLPYHFLITVILDTKYSEKFKHLQFLHPAKSSNEPDWIIWVNSGLGAVCLTPLF